jgi:hypothetical protein
MNPLIKFVWTGAKGICLGTVWLATVVVDETTLVPIGSAVMVLTAVWYLSARLQRMEDGIKEMSRRIKALEGR